VVQEVHVPQSPLLIAAGEAQAVCRQEGWRSCVIGGLAVLRWGRPRATRDVDLSLWTGFGMEAPFIDLLLQRFQPRIADAKRFALDNRVLLLSAGNGTPLDVALAGIPFEEHMQDRASPYEFSDDCPLVTASAEDLVVSKAFANRPQDWLDIEGILSLRSDELDWSQIEEELGPLAELKEAPEILAQLNQVRQATRQKSSP